ncbi:MAG: hypothetical protein ACE15B_10350 [Bryobacteraceae bacterium]
MRTLGLALLCCQWAAGAYSDLVAAADGSAVWFRVKTGFGDARWYSAKAAKFYLETQELNKSLADVNASGTTLAAASYGERYCGFAGSTCWVAASCSAAMSIGDEVSRSGRPTFLRLDRSGRLAWIDQQGECRGLGMQLPAPLNGLYEAPSLRQIAPAGGARLANTRYGRRLITDRGQALTFAGIQLQLLDAAGAHPVRHVAGAYEAVIDAQGKNIVYVEDRFGALHWIADTDEPLGLEGSAPALSDDGGTLLYLDAKGALQAYDRASRTVRRIGPDAYQEFTLAGSTVFAVTAANRLVRINLPAGEQFTWLEPFPEIDSVTAPPAGVSASCPLICYGMPDRWLVLGRSQLVVLAGRYLDAPGWRARSAEVDMPIQPISDRAAWFQAPVDLPRTGDWQPVEIYNPGHPLRFRMTVQVQDRAAVCLGTLHQDFSRVVAAEDPASSGEIVHVFLTGLPGEAPAFAPQVEPLYFGPAPGLIGMQQLDIRVLGPLETPLFRDLNSYGCDLPVAP